MIMSKRVALAVAMMAGTLGAATAQDLKIGVASEATSVDPHFHNVGQNNALRRHIFESLVAADLNQKPQPGLAAS